MSKSIYTNRLSGESSPYLRQHAHDPVDWYPWGEEAVTRAKIPIGPSCSQQAIRRAIGAMSWSANRLKTAALRDDISIIRPGEVKPEMFNVDIKRITTHGDLQQGVVLDNNDIIFVPRSFMGDVNDVITKIELLLNVLLIPATYRDLYTTGGGLWVDTGDAAAAGTTTGFTRPLPGVGKLAVSVEDEELQEENREAVEEEQEGAE